jgi:hypothetical protein
MTAIGHAIGSAGSAIYSRIKGKKSYTTKEEEDHTNFVPLDNPSACTYCLQVYLEPVKMRLCEGKIKKGDIYAMASNAAHIFHSMSQYWISHDHAQPGPNLDLKSVGSHLRLHTILANNTLCRFLRNGWNLYLNHLKQTLSKNPRSY